MLQSEQNSYSQWTFLIYDCGKEKVALSNTCTTFMVSVSFLKKTSLSILLIPKLDYPPPHYNTDFWGTNITGL